MSAAPWMSRAVDRLRPRRALASAASHGWIGTDLSSRADPRPARRLIPLLVIALVAALGISALRIDLIRTR